MTGRVRSRARLRSESLDQGGERPSGRGGTQEVSEPPPFPERTRWSVVAAAVGAGVAVAFQVGKVPPALPQLQASFGLSLVQAAWVISTFSVLGALCGAAVGTVADWLGHRRAVLSGLACIGVGSLLGAASWGANSILASRLLEGLGFVVSSVTMPALIFQVTRPGDHGFAFGLWGSYMALGMALMMFCAPTLLTALTWRGLWLVNGAALLGAAALLAGLTRNLPSSPPRRETPRIWRNLRLVATSRGPLLLAGSWVVYTMSFIVVLGFLPTMLMERGFSQSVAGAMTAAAVAVNIPGNLLAGWLLKRGWPRWVLLATANVAMGISVLGIYSATLSEAWRYGLCLVFSAAGGCQPPVVLGGTPAYAPHPSLAATTNGFVIQVAYLGITLGPPAAAALATASGGWHNTPWFLTTAAAAALLCSLGLRRVGVPGGV